MENQTTDDQQQRIIKSVQPYTAPADLKPEEIPLNFNRAIGILSDWARKDRHRRLHVVGTHGFFESAQFRLPEGVTLTELQVGQQDFMLEGAAVLATFTLRGWVAGMRMETNLALDIAADEIPPPCHHTDTLGKRLYVMEMAVCSVVSQLCGTVNVTPPDDFRIDFTPKADAGGIVRFEGQR